jgi:hypothetical protein
MAKTDKFALIIEIARIWAFAGLTPTPRLVRLAYQPPTSSTFLSEQTSHQPAVLFSQNKSVSAISHQPNEHAEVRCGQLLPIYGERRGRGGFDFLSGAVFCCYSLRIAFRSRYVQLSKLQNKSHFSSRWPKQTSLPLTALIDAHPHAATNSCS